jgi:uncharacterized membrane protein YozB (DUF420 family)
LTHGLTRLTLGWSARGKSVNSASFAAWHKGDRGFALAFALFAWAAVIVGFYPAVSSRWRGEADYVAPIIVQIHVFTFVAWLCLLTSQVVLIRTRRPQWHRLLGIAGSTLIPVLVVTGVGAELFSQRFYSPQNPTNLRFFIFPLTTMLSFAVVAAAAVRFRSNPTAHKRLMMVATALILIAPFLRWWGNAIYEVMGDDYLGTLVRNVIGPDLIIAAIVTYDLVTRRRVHPVLLVAVPLIIAAQLAAAAVYHASWWPGVVRSLVGL